MRANPRLLLIDPDEASRAVLAERLRLQGFTVVECSDGAEGAVLSLEDPPAAVVADLTMPSISGVQLCRLLGSEIGTSMVPVILRGTESRRNHFWAEQAGAFAYVPKGRMGELVRALRKAIDENSNDSDFFVVSSTQGLDVRERIATHLDAALFDSVIAARNVHAPVESAHTPSPFVASGVSAGLVTTKVEPTTAAAARGAGTKSATPAVAAPLAAGAAPLRAKTAWMSAMSTQPSRLASALT